MRILIGLLEHLGDIAACEPVARYLKKKHPEAHIAWAVSPVFQELIDSNPNIDETIALECLTDWIKLTKHKSYDQIVDLHVNYRICQHCGISLIKDHGHPFVSVYEWLDYGTLLEAFSLGAGLPVLSDAPRLYLDQKQSDAVDKLELPSEFCAIHVSSNNVTKDWRPEAWTQLSQWIKDELKLDIVEVGAGKSDGTTPLVGSISLFNKLSILETAEVIRRARFFIGIDSGPAHLANAVRTPSVILIGRHFYFRKYMPFNGLLGSHAPQVKIVRNLTGNVSELTVSDVIEAVRYVDAAATGWSRELEAEEAPIAAEKFDVPAGLDQLPEHEVARQHVTQSGYFDAEWYLSRNPVALSEGDDPLDHFILFGGFKGFSPGPDFDAAWYLERHKDVRESGIHPLLHYIRFGQGEGREAKAPKALADSAPIVSFEDIQQKLTVAAGTLLSTPTASIVSAKLNENLYPRTFAFYLPQFHPIPENDLAHGPGFSEWHNVIKGKPLFKGHYQPKVPGELGFYDLRSLDVMRRQIEIAQAHGVNGFCFYYYYFKGKKLLFQPIQQFIDSDINMPFFFLWANENWSKRWDGGNKEVIIAQEHSKEDDLAFIRELFSLFKDERYVKIGGKPLLLLYKAHLFPDISATTEIWREEAEKAGYPGLYLVMVDDWTQDLNHPRDFGFDASYEIPSNIVPSQVLSTNTDDLELAEDFEGRIVDYAKFASFHMARPFPYYKRFRTVMAPWDNTARYGKRALVHINGEGDAYKLWLMQALLDTYRRYEPDERIVFLHSWNEWCEGTYLEPDGKYGRYYLEQTKEAVDIIRQAIELGKDTPESIKVISELLKVMRAKDEGAFRVMQATRLQSSYVWRSVHELEKRLEEETSSLKAATSKLNRLESQIAADQQTKARPAQSLLHRLGIKLS